MTDVAVRTPCPVAFALAVAVTLVFARASSAQAGATGDVALAAASNASDPAVAADALFKLAEAEDARGEYGEAAARYRAAVAKLPSSRYAAKAVTRAAYLEAHAEGAWGPFAHLEAVRHDPEASSDPARIDALAAVADTFPPGPTRGEARMLCAEAYIARLHRRADGEGVLRKVVGDPSAEALVRKEAATGLVTALLEDGDLDAAQAMARDFRSQLDARMTTRVKALVRRHRIHGGAVAVLGAFAAFAGLACARAAGKGKLRDVGTALVKLVPVAALFALYSAVAGGGLASSYEAGNAVPFVAFGAALLPIAAASIAWGAAGSPTRMARIGRAALSATAVVAAAFLTLEAVNGQYLESFKL